MRVFVHTNASLLAPAAASRLGFELLSGWWPSSHNAELVPVRKRWHSRATPKWMIEQSYKWPWVVEQLVAASTALSARDRHHMPVLLADTDIIVQCTAEEMIARYKQFHTPLVASAERLFVPRPGGLPKNEDPSWHPFPYRPASAQRYPNSGLIMGVPGGGKLGGSNGFEHLWRRLRKLPVRESVWKKGLAKQMPSNDCCASELSFVPLIASAYFALSLRLPSSMSQATSSLLHLLPFNSRCSPPLAQDLLLTYSSLRAPARARSTHV